MIIIYLYQYKSTGQTTVKNAAIQRRNHAILGHVGRSKKLSDFREFPQAVDALLLTIIFLEAEVFFGHDFNKESPKIGSMRMGYVINHASHWQRLYCFSWIVVTI